MKNKPQPQLKQKIVKKQATIGIIGLGYVGLPLALAFSQAGFKVIGFDTQSNKVNLINKGESYIDDISSKDLKAAVTSKRFLATTVKIDSASRMPSVSACPRRLLKPGSRTFLTFSRRLKP